MEMAVSDSRSHSVGFRHSSQSVPKGVGGGCDRSGGQSLNEVAGGQMALVVDAWGHRSLHCSLLVSN